MVKHEMELHMRLFDWMSDAVLKAIADDILKKSSRIDSFPRWSEVIEAPISYQLLSLRHHEKARYKVFGHMSFEQMFFCGNEARVEAGHETIDATDGASWMRWSRHDARTGPGVFDDY